MKLGLTGVCSVLLVVCAACDEAPDPEDDQRLKAAIDQGAWPERSRTKEAEAAPLVETDPGAWRELLGAYEFTAHLTLQYLADDGAEEVFLNERTTLKVTRDGRYMLSVDKTHRRKDDPEGTSGRHAVFDGQRFYTRLTHGEWVERELIRKEHQKWPFEATRQLDVLTRMLGAGAKKTRTGRTLLFELGQWKKPALPAKMKAAQARMHDTDTWFAWWGRTHRPTRVRGTVTLHDTRDVVMGAEFEIEARLRKRQKPRDVFSGPEITPSGPSLFGPARPAAGEPSSAKVNVKPIEPAGVDLERLADARFKARLRFQVRSLTDDPTIVVPAEVRQPRRPRPLHLIDQVLGADG